MPPVKRISGNHGEWYMGLPASEPGSSRPSGSTFEVKGDRELTALISPTGDDNKAFTFVSGKSALIAPILEDDAAIDRTEDVFGSEAYEYLPVLEEDLLEMDDFASIPEDVQNLPKTIQAIRILTFLKAQLSVPFSDTRFTAPDVAAIHRRHPSIVATCKEWMPYLELVETEGMKSLVIPLYQFFQVGQALAWIEVMANTEQLHVVSEFAKGLRRWLDRVRRADQHQFEMIEKINVIRSWTNDLEHLVLEYDSCLKRFPSEVYFIAPTFLPAKSPLRSRIEALATLRGATPATNFSERNEWEPFKFLNLPTSITSDPSFISSSLSRFTFNPKGSLLAFRGAHQVVVFSVYTGTVVGTFKFPKREIACVAFGSRSSMLAVSFSTMESQLIDLRTGTLIEELSSPSTLYTIGNGVKRNSLVSLGKGGKKLHTGHKSLELGPATEEMDFAATYLEERTSAVGPDGVHALLTRDGIFKVSDETGDTLFFRRIIVDIETYKPSSRRMKRRISGKWGAGNGSSKSLSSSRNSLVSEKLSSIQHVYSGEVQYRCYDISAHTREDIVIDSLLQQSALGGQKSAESGFEFSFNYNGTIAILHTTNAFAAGVDLLHVANFSTKENPRLHIVYPSPAQPISGCSVNSEGDLIALCPQNLEIISIIRLTHGLEVYRIDPRQLQIEPVVGLSFAPGSGSMLMTAHSGKYTVFWEIGRLAENPGQVITVNAKALWNAQQHCIASDGSTILLNGVTEKYIRPLIFRLHENTGAEFTPVKPPFMSLCQDQSSPMAIASDGQSAVIGRHLYFFSPKFKTRKLSIPKGSKIVRTAMMSKATVAFGLLLRNAKSQVRVHNWSAKKDGFHDWIPSPDTILNIWALSFDEDRFLAIGVQLRSNGLDKFAVCLINRLKGGNLVEACRTNEWEIAKPINMAFGSGGRLVVVLANGSNSQEKSSPYSVFVFNIPSNSAEHFQATPVIRQLVASTQIIPSMTSEGRIFYLGREKDEGWIMELHEKSQNNEGDRRIAWCPLSWRSVGSLSFLCASKGDIGTIVCLNKVFGIVVLKL